MLWMGLTRWVPWIENAVQCDNNTVLDCTACTKQARFKACGIGPVRGQPRVRSATVECTFNYCSTFLRASAEDEQRDRQGSRKRGPRVEVENAEKAFDGSSCESSLASFAGSQVRSPVQDGTVPSLQCWRRWLGGDLSKHCRRHLRSIPKLHQCSVTHSQARIRALCSRRRSSHGRHAPRSTPSYGRR